jgi:hypothetical protein
MKKILTPEGRAVLRSADPDGSAREVCAVLAEIRNQQLYTAIGYEDFESFIRSKFPSLIKASQSSGFSINEIVDFHCQLIQEEN